MNESISLPCDAPESGIVLAAVTPSEDFFDAALDDLFTVGGEIQIETLNATDPLLPEPLDKLALWLSNPIELCTAVFRRPWEYPRLTFQVCGGDATW